MSADLEKYAGKKVAVAMSGGVDSSVAAFLLKEAGADVFGVSMTTVPGSTCCTLKDISEAGEVCNQLGIKHFIVSLKGLFEEKAVQYFVDESLKGRNPNPCVPCNQFVKFGALLDFAVSKGAEFMATGHYARLNFENRRWVLRRPVDEPKDQSYVLSMLSQGVFSKVIFPIGDLKKEEVRKIAKKAGLRVFNKPENQDLCFLHEEKGDFISKKIGSNKFKGSIVNKEGKVLAKHKGFFHYTIGQRKGLGINGLEKNYVHSINSKKNEVVVGSRDDLMSREFFVENVNWASIKGIDKPEEVEVLVRNKHVPHPAIIIPENEKVKVSLKKPIFGVSPGQLAVFCKGEVVLGGGWIC